jgi:hypothetical protein
LIEARRKTGPKRESLLTESWKHASTCEEREPAKGAYNLACISAERGDWETMSQWLRISARGPDFPAPGAHRHCHQLRSHSQRSVVSEIARRALSLN